MSLRAPPGPIALAGPAGVGKSTAGPLVADALGRPFIDLDREIVARECSSIGALFTARGEAGFRRAERAALEAVLDAAGAEAAPVIALGGGTVHQPWAHALLERHGVTLVMLDAPVDTLVARLSAAGAGARPLLGADGSAAALTASVTAQRAVRRARERAAWCHVPAGGTASDTAARVQEQLALAARLPRMTHLPVTAGQAGYPVLLGEALMDNLGVLAQLTGLVQRGGDVTVCVDQEVLVHHERALRRGFMRGGVRAAFIPVQAGEAAKSLAQAEDVYGQLAALGHRRDTPLFAIGGGTVGDLVGFVAATFVRGVPFVQVPTSLLAMVDASVGGKVAVNLTPAVPGPDGAPLGTLKNMVGAFYQPRLVVIDPGFLDTLATHDIASGMAEAIKHGVLRGPGLLGQLTATPAGVDTALLAELVRVKADVVARDPHESGPRKLLNLGHTVGHALETCTRGALSHGQAVALGMVAAATIAVRLGDVDGARVDATLPATLRKVCRAHGLPTHFDALDPADSCWPARGVSVPAAPTVDAMWRALSADKKHDAAGLTWIMPVRPGDVRLVRGVPAAAVEAGLAAIGVQSGAGNVATDGENDA